MHLSGLWVLDLCSNWDNLIIEPSSLLCYLRTSVTLCRITILELSGDVKVFANILRCLTHWLHTVGSVLVLQNIGVERCIEAIATSRHHFSTYGDTNIDTSIGNLVGNILCGLEAAAIDAGHGRCGSGVRETGCEGAG